MVMNIRIDARNVIQMLIGYERTIPIGARKGAWLATLDMQKEIRKEIRNQGLIWRGKLLRDTRARKISKNVFGLFMPSYGPMLDTMATHAVALKRGRLITQWAKDKGITARFITVRKHPFIDKPFLKSSRKTKRIIRREIRRAIKRKGR